MLDKRVLVVIESLGLPKPEWFNGFFGPDGAYDTRGDRIILNQFTTLVKVLDINFIALHEAIHATGHFKRLNRGIIGIQSEQLSKLGVAVTPTSDFSLESRQDEESVAQLGAYLLIKHLGIESKPCPDWYLKIYLEQQGRINGIPRKYEELMAQEAVNYIINLMESSERKVA